MAGVWLGRAAAGGRNGVENAANPLAFLFQALPDLTWAGFYFLRGSELVLGPFQGKVVCPRIALGRDASGAAAARRETVVVPDIPAFACDG
jgi:L-methionine (R)-S-oxide reductase